MLAPLLASMVLAQTGYNQWSHGPSTDPNYFPIAVWLQQPRNAPRFQAAGINLYVGLWQGPTEEQLAELKKHNMPVICDLNEVGMKHLGNRNIVAWMHNDEPDNAQAKPEGGWGPCVPPQKVVDDYKTIKKKDPTRPVFLNLGQGVANDSWIGRGEGASLKDYETYVQGADIVSYDIYPIADFGKPEFWYLSKGLGRLRDWTNGKKPIWNCIETGKIHNDNKPTPAQVRSEVWISLIHGSKGIIYFVHQFHPNFNEHALLDDPEMLAEVTKVNAQIKSLAPVLNSPTVMGQVKAPSPVALMTKLRGKDLYVFACNMSNEAVQTTVTLTKPTRAKVEVVDEKRTLDMKGTGFTDSFAPHGVHIYRIRN